MTFDLTFDYTFGLQVISGPVSVNQPACRQPGAYLYWLSPWGWMGYLFAGYQDTDVVVSSLGSYRQTGLTRHSQKEAATLLTLRAGKLDKQTSEIVATVYESVACYVLVTAPDDAIKAVPVEIEPGTFRVWSDANGRSNLEVKIILPARRGARS